LHPGDGRPVFDNTAQRLAEHRGSFDHGVLRMDTALRGRGEELAAPNGPLKLTPGTCTRVVLRPTEMYARLLAHRVSARSLASANGGWPTVERLLRRFEDASLGADAWDAVRAAEKAALQRADIPYVVADPQSGDLFDGMGDLLVPKAYQLDTRVSPSPAGDAQGQ
jgi:lantibiotic modifying enzyme